MESYSLNETFYLYPADVDDEPLHFTTHPEHVLSWNTAFNMGVWSVGGAALFSSIGLASYGATISFGVYALVITFNGIREKGLPAFLQGLWDDVTTSHDLTPEQRAFMEWFYTQYGLSWRDASNAYRKVFPEDTEGWAFQEWCDRTYRAIPLFNQTGFDSESQKLYGMTMKQAMGLFRQQQPDWKKYEQEKGADGREGTGPHTFYYWIEKQKEWHSHHLNSKYPENWRGGQLGPPPIKRNSLFASNITNEKDIVPSALIVGGAIVGEYFDHPVIGVALGVGSVYLYKRKRDAEPTTPSKKLKFSEEQLDSIYNQISAAREQLKRHDLSETERLKLEEKIAILERVY